MVDSSYVEETRREIIMSGITRYYRMVLQELSVKRSLYRTSEELKGGREKKSLVVRTWFKLQRGGSRVSEDKDFPETRAFVTPEGRKKPATETRTGERERLNREPRPKEGEARETKGRMIKVVETPVFIP